MGRMGKQPWVKLVQRRTQTPCLKHQLAKLTARDKVRRTSITRWDQANTDRPRSHAEQRFAQHSETTSNASGSANARANYTQQGETYIHNAMGQAIRIYLRRMRKGALHHTVRQQALPQALHALHTRLSETYDHNAMGNKRMGMKNSACEHQRLTQKVQ